MEQGDPERLAASHHDAADWLRSLGPAAPASPEGFDAGDCVYLVGVSVCSQTVPAPRQ